MKKIAKVPNLRFPNSESPRLRFPEFSNKWEVKRLGEIAKFSKGKGISKINIDENGTIECIRYGELYTYYGEVITEIKSKTNIGTTNLIFSERNDVIIPSSGETQIDIATASCVLKAGVALGGDLNIIKTYNNGVFLSYYLNSKKKIEIASLAQGISVVHLYSSQLALLEITIPSILEQKKIADFLALINDRISTQSKIIEQLKTLIKAICQEIIQANIPNSKLKDCVVCNSSSLTEAEVLGNTGPYPVYGATGIIAYTSSNQIDEDAILIIKDGASVGKVQYGKEKLSVIGTLNYLTTKQNICLKYIYYCLQFFNFDKYKVGSGIPHIYFKDYGEAYIYCPSVEEQEKIALTLSKIDEKLEIETAILGLLAKQKQYLLQNLFI